MTEGVLEWAKAADLCTAWIVRKEIVPELIAEVKRLRSLNESLMENGNDLRTRCQKAETRIKELEAEIVRQMEIGRGYKQMAEEMSRHNERLEAAAGGLEMNYFYFSKKQWCVLCGVSIDDKCVFVCDIMRHERFRPNYCLIDGQIKEYTEWTYRPKEESAWDDMEFLGVGEPYR